MLRSAILALLLTIGLGLAACSSTGIVNERPAETMGESYRLDSGDKLQITVFGQEDLSGAFTVNSAGAVALPLIEPVQARGLTVPEFSQAISVELGRTLLRNPNVSVQITEFRPFFILGEVARAGQYPYIAGMTVQSAVAVAGGFSYRANQDIVRITRQRGDKIIELNADISASVLPGDTILVKERYF
ncbi:MAG: polysaccharide export protein [Rhizobiales bacterium]|nr:polysaccharide export protein [Hyphomicrobiales bacterium]